jgi:predicted membrane channel-forming protein YqfA (hemolysin III family)
MNLRTVSRLLIGGGAVLLAYGLFMDTTVQSGYGRVVNLHLASTQQSALIVGGVLLICGVLLYGFRRLKQTAEDEDREAAQRKLAAEAAAQRVGDAQRWVKVRTGGFLARIRAGLEDRRKLRLTVAVLVGLWLGGIAALGIFHEQPAALVVGSSVAACALYALWSRDARGVQKWLLYLCTGVSAIVLLKALGDFFSLRARLNVVADLAEPGSSSYISETLLAAYVVLGIMATAFVVSALALASAIRAERRERSE